MKDIKPGIALPEGALRDAIHVAIETQSGSSLQRVVRRGRSNATQAGLALCVEWTTWCRNNGWAEEHLMELEGLFWKYRDADGKLKAPNRQTEFVISREIRLEQPAKACRKAKIVAGEDY